MIEERRKNPQGAADRRLRIIVYASLLAFFILAAYGFYLIYHLTRDVHEASVSVALLTASVTKQMQQVAKAMDSIPKPIASMAGNTDSMAHNTESMARNMQYMARTNAYMAETNARMQADMWSLNRSVSTPMAPFTAMMPWSGGGSYLGSYGPMRYPPPYPPPR